jgi:hypothetical protein
MYQWTITDVFEDLQIDSNNGLFVRYRQISSLNTCHNFYGSKRSCDYLQDETAFRQNAFILFSELQLNLHISVRDSFTVIKFLDFFLMFNAYHIIEQVE